MEDTLGPYPENRFDPFDVLISDIKPEDLPGRISKFMGVNYLSYENEIRWPLEGRIIASEKKLRILFTVPVAARQKTVNVHFIFDTGSPRTYLAKSVIDALEVPEVCLGSEVFKYNGVKWSDVNISDFQTVPADVNGEAKPCHFGGINILGMDFLDKIDAILIVDVKSMVAKIIKG